MSKYKPKNKKINHLPAKSFPNQCDFITSDGRRCRLARLRGHKSLCPQHAIQDRQIRDAEKTAIELLGPLDDFRSAQAINHALGKLFSLTGQNRIPVRNAAVLAYIAQLLLQTLRPLRNEIIEAGGAKDLHVVFRDALALLRNEYHYDDPFPTEGPVPRKKPRATIKERAQKCFDRMVAGGIIPEGTQITESEPDESESEQDLEEQPEGSHEV